MGLATFIEKWHGTAFVASHIYGAWWFTVLWALLTAVGIVYFIRRNVRRPSIIVLHLAFVVILAGALVTHLTSWQGMVHLRIGETMTTYTTTNDAKEILESSLPFTLILNDFHINYHKGTRAAEDYSTSFTLIEKNDTIEGSVAMNRIFSHRGVRLYQSSYDPDGRGSVLAVNADSWGIPITYVGYALLFIALLWMLLDPKGTYRRLWRTSVRLTSTVTVLFILLTATPVSAAKTLPRATAQRLGQLNMLHNDRICPVETFAIDFTKKLCGRRSYADYMPEQVLAGFLFYPDEWNDEPIVKIKSSDMQRALSLSQQGSVNAFFDAQGGYRLGPWLQEYYRGQSDKLHQEVVKIDDKLLLVMSLRDGEPLKLFPYKGTWYSPADKFPPDMEPQRQEYIRNIFQLLIDDAQADNYERMNEALDKILNYQQRYGAEAIPAPLRLKAEHLLNAIPFATILFMVNLTMGFVCLLLTLLNHRQRLAMAVMAASALALSIALVLRWIASATIPMSNGYETMLFMAWLIMMLTLCLQRRFPIMLTMGFLMSGFFLLVSHISQMDPQIGHLMPVLRSPLLTIHVSIIMMAFALLSLTFICSLTGLCLRRRSDELMLLSQIFLHPALTCLGFGIFTGAIWANLSWGTYWSWDPKETWALITLMIYAVGVHQQSIPWLQRPRGFHLYMVLSFLTLLMTYFGVNYFLGGMHSYA